MKKFIHNENSAVGHGWSNIEESPPPYRYLSGTVTTPHGSVFVYSKPGTDAHSTLQFVTHGRIYRRRIRRFYSKRGLVTMAKRFAAESTAGVTA